MNLCFVDFSRWDYNVDGPTIKPLGGSQSGLCYLAIEMARAGHNVTIVTGTSKPGIVQGVECLNLDNCNQYFFLHSKFDVVVVLNGGSHSKLRDIIPSSTRLILWTQHETVQPAMRKLSLPEYRDRWDHIVFVSEWQRGTYYEAFGIQPERTSVIRNAIAPSFQNLFVSKYALIASKTQGPLKLVYTSTPYRGLKHLTEIFPKFRDANPDAELDVYSSMAVYHVGAEEDGALFQETYDALQAMPGVKYFGSVRQPYLASRLIHANILAYPNVFPETSCIAVMEAMAAGLRVVTTDFAALPETTEGFADLVPIDFRDLPDFVERYGQVLSRPYSVKDDADRLYAQVEHMNEHHTWRKRAGQWADCMSRVGELV